MSDLISRQAAIELCDWYEHEYSEVESYFQKFNEELKDLPSSQPERKKGKWLFTDAAPHRVYCSVCYKTYVPNKEWIAWAEDMIPKNFCPNCGSDMRDKP